MAESSGLMRCLVCDGTSRVNDSRYKKTEDTIRRRRECRVCGHRFTTVEMRRETYDETVRLSDAARTIGEALTSEAKG